MEIINYNYGYNNTFNCSIHGKIIVSKEEWNKIEKYIFNSSVTKDIFYRNILRDDIKRLIYTKEGTLLNIRVTATRQVIDKFRNIQNRKKYKLGNYMFLVKY
jgi:hypothetical protein